MLRKREENELRVYYLSHIFSESAATGQQLIQLVIVPRPSSVIDGEQVGPSLGGLLDNVVVVLKGPEESSQSNGQAVVMAHGVGDGASGKVAQLLKGRPQSEDAELQLGPVRSRGGLPKVEQIAQGARYLGIQPLDRLQRRVDGKRKRGSLGRQIDERLGTVVGLLLRLLGGFHRPGRRNDVVQLPVHGIDGRR